MSKRSRRIERRTKRKSWRMTCQESQEQSTPEVRSDKKCIFCGATGDLQRHHICQKRFNGPDTEDNLVWICPQDHKVLHWLMDQNLNWISHRKAIDKHEIRPVPLISDKPVTVPILLPPTPLESTKPTVMITGGEVSITFN